MIFIIIFKHVNKWYNNGLHVLKNIDLNIKKEEVVVLIGASGSGKSTLIRCINNLEAIQEGEIIINGVKLDKNSNISEIRAEIGMVFQLFDLFPHKNVLENIILGPCYVRHMQRKDAEEIAIDLLKKVGLEEKASSYPSSLSGGEKQRVAIARALAMKPKIMLFDEPTSALDPEMIKEVLDIMVDLAQNWKMTMVVITHEMKFARQVANRIIYIDRGQIIESGEAKTFFENPKEERTKRFLSKILL